MIRYALRCENGHKYNDWFDSIADYEAKEANGELTCKECGTHKVTRAIMAPKVDTDGGMSPSAHKKAAAAEHKFGGASCSSCPSNMGGSCPFSG